MSTSVGMQAASQAGCVRVPLKVKAWKVEDASDGVELVVQRPVTGMPLCQKSPESSTPFPPLCCSKGRLHDVNGSNSIHRQHRGEQASGTHNKGQGAELANRHAAHRSSDGTRAGTKGATMGASSDDSGPKR